MGIDPNNENPSAPPPDAGIDLEMAVVNTTSPSSPVHFPDAYYKSIDPPAEDYEKDTETPKEDKTTIKEDVKIAVVAVKEAAQDAVYTVKEAFDSDAADRVFTISRLFCGVCQISCHWWMLFVLFPLYISLACFGLIGWFHSMGNNWVANQEICVANLPQVMEQCVLVSQFTKAGVTPTDPRIYVGWNARPTNSSVNVRLYPDCRYIIKDGYAASSSQLYGPDLASNSTVDCWLPSNWRNGSAGTSGVAKNITGVLTVTIWPSNTAKTGQAASIGVAVGVFVCFAVCAGISWALSSDVRENCVVDLHEAGDVETDWMVLCCYPNTVYFTFNPFYCLKFAIPITATCKFICNVMIVVITVTVIAIYAIGSSNCYNCRY